MPLAKIKLIKMKIYLRACLILILFFAPFTSWAQLEYSGYLEFKYDNFQGADADDFQTDLQGLGSINASVGGYLGYTFGEGPLQPFINLGLGFVGKNFRFENDYTFAAINDELFFVPDLPNREYGEGFFTLDQSKLHNFYFRLNPELGFKLVDNIMISGGPVIDLRLFIYQNNRYKVDGARVSTDLLRNDHFDSEFIHFGWKGNIGTPSFGAFATYMMTPIMNRLANAEVYPWSVGIYFRGFDGQKIADSL